MAFSVVCGDITKLCTDAIVNAANSRLKAGGGVCGAIFRAAGREQLQAACDTIGFCEEGGAVLTEGFSLPASYVIHTVGPVWRGGMNGEEQSLRSCYRKCLGLAGEKGLSSVAFPLISAGIFGYPKAEALRIAKEEIEAFLLKNQMDVKLVLFDAELIALAEKMGIKP